MKQNYEKQKTAPIFTDKDGQNLKSIKIKHEHINFKTTAQYSHERER